MDLIAIKIPNNLKTELTDRPPSRWETDPKSTTEALKTEPTIDLYLIEDRLEHAI